MKLYQVPKSARPSSNCPMYEWPYPITKYHKIRCYQLHVDKWTIPIEKYGTHILTWNRKTKNIEWSDSSNLENPDLRIVLLDKGSPTYHKYSMSWTHINRKNIYTDAEQLTIPLDEQYSYVIKSNMYAEYSSELVKINF
jgi:hypothetical protein